jgi:F-type H+-transporting ATPase subunit c
MTECIGSMAAVGLGLVALGTGLGIGKVGSAALTAMAQNVQTQERIPRFAYTLCTLIQLVALFCAVGCLCLIFR